VKLSRPLFWLPALILLAGCGGSTGPVMPNEVTGAVVYREPIQLPPGAALYVSLVDLSAEDQATRLVGGVTLPAEGRQPPLPFTIRFDPKTIDPTHTYALQAQVSSGGKPLLTTTEAHLVLTGGRPSSLEVTLHPVEGSAPTPAASPRRVVLRQVAAIDAALPSMDRREGRWEAGDAVGPYTAYFDGTGLRRLEERLSLGDQGTSQWSYSFGDGNLIFASGEDVRPSAGPEGGRRDVVTTVWFGPTGEVLGVERTVDGVPETPGATDVEGIRMHAMALRDAAFSQAP